MATTTEVHRQADLNLQMMRLMLADLAEIAAEWNDVSTDERISWSLDWSNEVARLELLAGHDATDGLLTEAQQAHLCAVRQQLEAALPVIRRLGLQAPSAALDNC